jgi:hypothetical protein
MVKRNIEESRTQVNCIIYQANIIPCSEIIADELASDK